MGEFDSLARYFSEHPQEARRVLPHKLEPGAIMRRACEVVSRPVYWLWPGRIPLGKLTLLIGDPGLGKSLLTIAIASCVSRGATFPDAASCQPGSVILLTAEDDAADTIRPRLDAAGADVSRVHFLEAVRDATSDFRTVERTFSLETDLWALEDAFGQAANARLLVIDPISAYLGSVDSHKNGEVRSLLSPLAAVAAKHKIAVVAVSHLRKSPGAALHRSIGSIAFTAAARAVWAVAADPGDPTRRLVPPVKQNLAADIGGLAYRIEGPGGVPRLVWEGGAVRACADEVLGGLEDRTERSERQQAAEWLRAVLVVHPSAKGVTRLAGVVAAMGAEGKNAMSFRGQFDFAALLEMVGAKPPRNGRGKWGCPFCGRPAHVSVDFAKEAFKCWHAGCGFRGYRQTLEKWLGLRQKLSPAERRERQPVFSESRRAAEWLAAQLRTRRFRLYQTHQALLTIIFGAGARLRRDSGDEIAWSGLVYAYPQIDSARAEIALLESAAVETRIAFLDDSPASRKEKLRTVIQHGGLFDRDGRFIEIETHCPGMLSGD